MKKRNKILFSAMLVLMIAFVVLLFFYSPNDIVAALGAHNTYLIAGVLGVLAGISSFSAPPFYSSVSAFAIGGVSTLLLALVGGISLSLGHIAYYYLGHSGRKVLSTDLEKRVKKMSTWIEGRGVLTPLFAFLYFAFTPFPNELILVPLGVAKYSVRVLFTLLLLGNVVLVWLIAHGSSLV